MPQTFQTEGRPRRNSSWSWTSSKTSEKLCTSSTATAAHSASAYRRPNASQVSRAMFARRRLPGRSPALRRPRWYWTISVSNALWLEPARCERRARSRSSAWFIACRRSVRLAKVLLFISEPRCGKASASSNFRKATRLQGRDGGRARAEHGDLQLPLEAVEQPAHRLLAFGGGGQHRVREPGQVGA